MLRRPHPYEAALPHDLVPVRNLQPVLVQDDRTDKPILAVLPDFRRLDGETLAQIAFVVAGHNGLTVEEVEQFLTNGNWELPIPAYKIAAIFTATSLDAALAAADEFRATGTVANSFRQDVLIPRS